MEDCIFKRDGPRPKGREGQPPTSSYSLSLPETHRYFKINYTSVSPPTCSTFTSEEGVTELALVFSQGRIRFVSSEDCTQGD